nr:conjugal transfer protein [Haloferax sp. ATB1]
MNADELANFLLVPSGDQLSVEGARGTRAEQQSRNPLPRPHQDLMQEFRNGMAIGYALDENGEPEDVSTCIPPKLLTTHYGRFGTTGAGKSKAFINEILSLHENTEGPVIVVEPKGDGMAENYMRAHARRFGITDLEENVIHFPMPDVLPGFSFFDLGPALENGRRREDAVQRKAEHYEEILKLVMGRERYERAVVSPTLIRTLIKALFDEEHGRENGLYRESADYFAHRQLEHTVDQVLQAGPPNPNFDDLPKSSEENVARTLRRQLQKDPKSFSAVMDGVGHRLNYISDRPYLAQVFNTTENRFDFRDVLDENKIILFDLGDLRDDASRLMTGLILSNLDDALKERKREVSEYPDDYVVNLLVDEASSVVVSNIMNGLLEKGRSFRLSVGLSMQFPEQMEAEGGRKVYLNALNNIGSSLVGQINVDRELARAMAHEGLDPDEFSNRIRSLPRGEWIANLPSPKFGETGPYPFSIKPLPIPAGHPESDYPFTEREEQQFKETLSAMHERAESKFGVSNESAPSTQTPEELQEILTVTDVELDVVLAKVVRSIQLQNDACEENGWVAVEAVDDELRRLFAEVEVDAPSYDELASIRQRSRLLETTVDIDADEVIIRLSDAGEDISRPDTGDVRSAGGGDHDAALLELEEELSKLGFTVSILSQDGSEMPDARATHPELEETFAIEVETTTPDNPIKVLTNLRKAQEEGTLPLFVVRPGDTETYWAERVDNILSPPVRELASGEKWYYTHDSPLTFNGGATEQGGVTAVRPVNGGDDSKRTVWAWEDESIVLRDGSGTEYLRVSEWPSVTKERVPATYSYDPAVDKYLVYGRGETHVYESKDAFEAEWVKIKEPFIPDNELPDPAYHRGMYSIVILREAMEPVVFHGGELEPLSTLVNRDNQSGHSKDNGQDAIKNSDDSTSEQERDVTFESFVDEYLIPDEDAVLPKGKVRSLYEAWAEDHGRDPLSPSWFSRKLGNHLEFTTDRRRINGELVRVFVGFGTDTCQNNDGED